MRYGCVLHHALGQSFGGSHDARRANGLVGRDQDEVLDAGVDGCIYDVGGAVDVIGDGIDDVFFHERHVLVGSGVEDGIRAEIVEYRVHSSAIADIRDCRNDAEAGKSLAQFGLDIEYRIFAVAEYDEPGGFESGQLTAKLAPDRSAGTSDEDGAPFAQVPDGGKVGMDGVSAQKVLDLDIAKRRRRGSARQDIRKWRKSASLEARVGSFLDDAAYDGSRRGGDSDDYGADVVVVGYGPDIGNLANDRDFVEPELVLALVVIDEGDGIESETGVGEELLGDHLAGCAGTDDDGAHVVIAPTATGVPVTDAEEETRRDDEGAHEQGVECDYRDGNAVWREPRNREDDEAEQGSADSGRADAEDDSFDFSDAGVAPYAAVEAGENEYCERGGSDGEREGNCGEAVSRGEWEAVEAKSVGEPDGDEKGGRV